MDPKGWDAQDPETLLHTPSGPGEGFTPAGPGLPVPSGAERLGADTCLWINPKPSRFLTETNGALLLHASVALQPQTTFLSCRQRVSLK